MQSNRDRWGRICRVGFEEVLAEPGDVDDAAHDDSGGILYLKLAPGLMHPKSLSKENLDSTGIDEANVCHVDVGVLVRLDLVEGYSERRCRFHVDLAVNGDDHSSVEVGHVDPENVSVHGDP